MTEDRRQIFISYRRGDEPGYAQSLYLILEQAFGAGRIFKDIEGGFDPGDDFPDALRRRVAEAEVLLAVIGPGWLSAADDGGRRRLDDPADWVRAEIALALAAGKRVIPVLVNGAAPPEEAELPHDLAPLARRQVHVLRNASFGADGAGLVAALRRVPGLGRGAPGRMSRRWLVAGGGALAGAAAVWAGVSRTGGEDDWFTVDGPAGAATDQSLRVFEGHLEDVRGVRLRPDGASAVSVSLDRTVRIWDVASGETTRLIPLPGSREDWSKASLSPEGRRMVLWQTGRPAELWDLDTGGVLRRLEGIEGVASAAAFSPDGLRLAVSGARGPGGVWDLATGRRVLPLGLDGAASVDFLPDGRLILCDDMGEDATMRWTDPGTGAAGPPVGLSMRFGERPGRVLASPDGEQVAVFDYLARRIQLRSVADGALRWTLVLDAAVREPPSVLDAVYTPDGRRLITGGSNSRVHVFDSRTGTLERRLDGHANWVQAVDVSRDGRHILSGSSDATLRLWALDG